LDPAGCCLASIHSKEGTSAEEWPASPALQSVNLQEIRSGQPAAFLVGMSGKSHWSASVETIPNEGALVFDVACRVHEQSQWLGTKYIAEYFSARRFLTIFRHSKSGIEVAVYDPDGHLPGLALNGQQLELPCLEQGKGLSHHAPLEVSPLPEHFRCDKVDDICLVLQKACLSRMLLDEC
jgi:hypothetical protein